MNARPATNVATNVPAHLAPPPGITDADVVVALPDREQVPQPRTAWRPTGGGDDRPTPAQQPVQRGRRGASRGSESRRHHGRAPGTPWAVGIAGLYGPRRERAETARRSRWSKMREWRRCRSAEIDVDEELVAGLLRAQHPDLAGRRLRPLADGWDNDLVPARRRPRRATPRRAAAVDLDGPRATLVGRAGTSPAAADPRTGAGRAAGAGLPWPWSIVPWLAGTSWEAAPPSDSAPRGSSTRGLPRRLHLPAPADARTTRSAACRSPSGPSGSMPPSVSSTAASTARGAVPCSPSWRAWPCGIGRRCGCTATCTPEPRGRRRRAGRGDRLRRHLRRRSGDRPGGRLDGPATASTTAPSDRPRAPDRAVDDATWHRARAWALALAVAFLAAVRRPPADRVDRTPHPDRRPRRGLDTGASCRPVRAARLPRRKHSDRRGAVTPSGPFDGGQRDATVGGQASACSSISAALPRRRRRHGSMATVRRLPDVRGRHVPSTSPSTTIAPGRPSVRQRSLRCAAVGDEHLAVAQLEVRVERPEQAHVGPGPSSASPSSSASAASSDGSRRRR